MATSTQVKRRRGTQTQCDAMTPAEAEVIVDLSYDTLRVGDGVKAGGFIMPNAKHLQSGTFNSAIAGGDDTDMTASFYPPITSLGFGVSFKLKMTETNVGPVTLDVDGLGPVAVKKVEGTSIVDLDGGELVDNGVYEIVHDGTQFLLITAVPQSDTQVTAGGFGISNLASRFYDGASVSLLTVNTFYVPYSGTVRLNTAVTSTGVSNTSSGRWYKNGTQIVTHSTTTSGTWTDDVSVTAGDVLVFYGQKSSASAGRAFTVSGNITASEYLPAMAMV